MKYTVLFCTALLVIAAVRGQGSSAAGRYFAVKDDVIETIRQLIGEANQEAVSLPSAEVMARIKVVMENEINKFRYVGQRAEYSVDSCHSISELQPCSPSGYYFVDTISGPIAVWCAMNQDGLLPGGWMRVAMVNMTNNASHCPKGFSEVVNPKRLCVKPVTTAGCSSAYLDVHGVNYSKVCGRVKGYQYHTPEAFYAYSSAVKYRRTVTLDNTYVDGVSITYGRPRKHIWTLVAAMDEARDAATMDKACPCTNTDIQYGGTLPPYVGEDYYCETGCRTTAQAKYYLQDPLWDGKGCGVDSTCCDHSEWFCKDLGEETDSDIELRICTNEATTAENILLEEIEFFVQ